MKLFLLPTNSPKLKYIWWYEAEKSLSNCSRIKMLFCGSTNTLRALLNVMLLTFFEDQLLCSFVHEIGQENVIHQLESSFPIRLKAGLLDWNPNLKKKPVKATKPVCPVCSEGRIGAVLKLKPEWHSRFYQRTFGLIIPRFSPSGHWLTSPGANVCAFGTMVLDSRNLPHMSGRGVGFPGVVWGWRGRPGTQQHIALSRRGIHLNAKIFKQSYKMFQLEHLL